MPNPRYNLRECGFIGVELLLAVTQQMRCHCFRNLLGWLRAHHRSVPYPALAASLWIARLSAVRLLEARAQYLRALERSDWRRFRAAF